MDDTNPWFELEKNFITGIHYTPTAITSLAIDYQYPLIWAGDSQGRVSSYNFDNDYSVSQYSSFVPSKRNIKELLPDKRGIWILAEDILQLRKPSGLVSLSHRPQLAENFQCMDINKINQNEIIISVGERKAKILNMDRGTVQKKIEAESEVTAMSFEKELILGTATGMIVIRDPRYNFKATSWVDGYSGGLCSLKTSNSYILTSGFTLANGEDITVEDWSVKLFDSRKLTEPISEYNTYTPTTLYTSSELMSKIHCLHDDGFIEELDISSGSIIDYPLFQAEVNDICMATSAAIVGDYKGVAIGDSSGILHFWNYGYPEENSFFSSTEKLNSPSFSTPQINFPVDDDRFRLSSVKSPYYINLENNVNGIFSNQNDNDIRINELPNLLSDSFGKDLVFDAGKPAGKVAAEVLSKMQIHGIVGSVANTTRRRHNQVVESKNWRDSLAKKDKSKSSSVFISNKNRNKFDKNGSPKSPSDSKSNQTFGYKSKNSHNGALKPKEYPNSQNQKLGVGMNSNGFEHIPEYLKRVEIQYSRFGVEDFNFYHYNKTSFGGLESNITNSYMNSLLQVLYFSPFIKSIAVKHSKSLCKNSNCLLCELGFLFSMLEDSNGSNCQATNLLRKIGELPEASALDILEPESPTVNTAYTRLVQAAHRFILEQTNSQCSADIKGVDGDVISKPIEETFGIPLVTSMECTCGFVEKRTSKPFAIELTRGINSFSSSTLLSGGQANLRKIENGGFTNFSQLVSSSLKFNENYNMCPKCKNKNRANLIRTLSDFPGNYIAINCPLPPPPTQITTSTNKGSSPSNSTFWWKHKLGNSENWLPNKINFYKDETGEFCVGQDNTTNTCGSEVSEYELYAVISEIRLTPTSRSHLIAHIYDLESKSWYCFNDFVVEKVNAEEVCMFTEWRVPSIIYYRSSLNKDSGGSSDVMYNFSLLKEIFSDSKILSIKKPKTKLGPGHFSPSKNNRTMKSGIDLKKPIGSKKQVMKNVVVPLTDLEIMQILNLKSDKVDEDSDDTKSKIFKCAIDAEFVMLAAADTEIHSSGTESLYRPRTFSLARVSVVRGEGPLEEGDLDVETSPHKLVTFKQSYRKLRALVDCGCLFIGHGLASDFRTINLFVPKTQISDTVKLFQSSRHMRIVNLKFLAWYFLGLVVQKKEHCSIEDSVTALKLYKKFKELKDTGRIDVEIENMYNTGFSVNWKLPTQ
ncbi:hypothetical protein BB559_002293 [Furculomyces boomerangus]|uniref:USP domain-containing protein n=1 Tax=Furculomyces boomerangus TaxID=61424 RepID=A0A2T9YWF6_9FUNG|nr:hypothetical protein BB559_002293 [Furculomyces boomerangus]